MLRPSSARCQEQRSKINKVSPRSGSGSGCCYLASQASKKALARHSLFHPFIRSLSAKRCMPCLWNAEYVPWYALKHPHCRWTRYAIDSRLSALFVQFCIIICTLRPDTSFFPPPSCTQTVKDEPPYQKLTDIL